MFSLGFERLGLVVCRLVVGGLVLQVLGCMLVLRQVFGLDLRCLTSLGVFWCFGVRRLVRYRLLGWWVCGGPCLAIFVLGCWIVGRHGCGGFTVVVGFCFACIFWWCLRLGFWIAGLVGLGGYGISCCLLRTCWFAG